MKRKSRIAIILAVVLCLTFTVTGALFASADTGALPGVVGDEVHIAEKLPTVNTPVVGWGNFNHNLTCTGGPIVVGGTTYDYNSLGMHLLATADNQDVVYDISEYAEDYPYFVMEVAQPADGNNNIVFEVLVDGVVKDTFTWTGLSMSPAGKPVVMRAYVKGAKTLTLRSRWGHTDYANGTFVYLNVRLQKETIQNGYVSASRILERANTTNGGWDSGYGWNAVIDRQHNNSVFDFPIYADHLVYDEGISAHLLNGTSYAENKVNSYITWKWDISSFDFRSFSAVAYAQMGFGFHVDAWADGVEIYTSGLIESVGTKLAHEEDPRLAPRTIDFAIPEGTKTLELHIIADTVFNDGTVQLLGPTFFTAGEHLNALSADAQAGDVWPFATVRGRMWNGTQTTIYCAETDEVKTAANGLYFVAGTSQQDATSYTFDISNVNANCLTGVLGKAGIYAATKEGASKVVLNAVVTYADGTTETSQTQAIDWSNSGSPVQIAHWGENAQTLTLYLTADELGWSDTVLAEAKLGSMFQVSFDDGVNTTTELLAAGQALVKPADPAKVGYSFAGWVLEGESEVFDFTGKTVTGDMRFTAKFQANEYNVIYQHELEDAGTEVVKYVPNKYVYDTAMQLPAPAEIEHYVFAGWYVDERKVESLGKESYTADITVTAKYTLLRYSVSFDGKAQEYKAGSALTKPADPSKEGFTFGGWKLSGENAAFDFTNATVTGDLVFEPIWNANTYNVIYKQQLGEAEATDAEGYAPTTRVYDVRFDLPQAKELEGHTFLGWFVDGIPVEYIDANSLAADVTVIATYSVNSYKVSFYNGEALASEQTVAYNGKAAKPEDLSLEGHSFDGWFTSDGKPFDFDTAITGDVVLTAKFSPKTFTVTYTHKLGTTASAAEGYGPTTHVFGTVTTLPAAQTVEGYTFDGWYVDGQKVTALDANAYLADITVEGRFTLNRYTVTFVDEGQETKVSYDHGQKIDRPLEREGYDFGGWFTDKECTTAYDAEAPVTGDMTLYAKWTAQTDATLWIIIGVIAVCAIGAAVFFVLRKKKSGK